jgi:hypothetical protein
MALVGQGVVAIWNDIAPEGRAEFYEWHNREHMPERVGIPGFRRGRRYVAKHGAPEYFTLYEAESAEVLSGQDYLNRLNNPTPWTMRVVPPYFRNTVRGICRVRLSLAVGDGGHMLTLQFGPQQDRAADLDKYLRYEVLPPLIDMPGVVGVHLCVADAEASDVETAERKGRHVAIPKWLIMIESIAADAADAACDRIAAGELAKRGAAAGHDRALYMLQNSRVKAPSELLPQAPNTTLADF